LHAGLGLYEYMLLNEELGTEPIWVINNGLSHEESVPTAQIQALVQDALDSIEFITGDGGTQWGALRAAMGHPEPWSLTYIGIGNEVGVPPHLCDRPCVRASGVQNRCVPSISWVMHCIYHASILHPVHSVQALARHQCAFTD
jgi:alpha-L-arabinofuranosidase